MNHLTASVYGLLISMAGISTASAGIIDVAPAPAQAVPVLDTWGLLGISALLAILGILSLKRRK